MDFSFTEEQQEIFAAVGEICEEELKPKAAEVDQRGEYPWDNINMLAELDLLGVPVPAEHGGLGLGILEWAVIGELLSAACTTTGAVYGAHLLAEYPIMEFGTEEQKEKYLVPLARG